MLHSTLKKVKEDIEYLQIKAKVDNTKEINRSIQKERMLGHR